MSGILSGFKAFVMRGNLIELAVAFVIGAAFATLMQALVADLVTPIVAAVFGEPSFEGLSFTINGSEFLYGHFLNALLTFLSIAAAIYFFVVVPYDRLQAAGDDAGDEGVRALPVDDPRRCKPLCVLHATVEAQAVYVTPGSGSSVGGGTSSTGRAAAFETASNSAVFLGRVRRRTARRTASAGPSGAR